MEESGHGDIMSREFVEWRTQTNNVRAAEEEMAVAKAKLLKIINADES